MHNVTKGLSSSSAIAILTTILAIPAAYAHSGDVANTQDAQCVIIGARISGLPNQQQKDTGRLLTVYFLGRIEGRSPTIDLVKLIKLQTAAITSNNESQILRRCGKEFASQGAELVRIGRLLAKSRK